MALWLGAFAGCAEGLGLVSSTHMAVHNSPELQFHGTPYPLLAPLDTRHDTHAYMQTIIYTYKNISEIKKNIKTNSNYKNSVFKVGPPQDPWELKGWISPWEGERPVLVEGALRGERLDHCLAVPDVMEELAALSPQNPASVPHACTADPGTPPSPPFTR